MQQFLIEADSNEVTKYLEQELLEEVFEEYGVILTGQEVRFAAALRKNLVMSYVPRKCLFR